MRKSSKPPAVRLEAIPWRGEAVSRLILGTVQLGMHYGIANVRGKPDAAQAQAIVAAAWGAGIRHFDTAQAYGDSEAVLGQALRALGIADEACIASKLAAHLDPEDLSAVEAAIEETFARLGVERLWCLMFHQARWLGYWDGGLGDLLLRYRASGRIQHLGVSISPPEEAAACLAHPQMAVLQMPCNAWDRRLRDQGVFEAARQASKLSCVRSVYLQGLLSLPPDAVAQKLPAAHAASLRWQAFAREQGCSPVELALRFALTLDLPLVVGAESPGQLRETAAWMGKGPLPPKLVEALEKAMTPVVSAAIVEPWRWPGKEAPAS